MTDLFKGGSTTDLQIEIIDEQINEMQNNAEFSDIHKEREIRKLELAKAQVIDSAERAGLEAEKFERSPDFFRD